MAAYLDNAATSFPKPSNVIESMTAFMAQNGATSGRGAYQKALLSDQLVFQARSKTARFFNHPDPKTVVFTKNVTEAVNIALKGFLKSGDQVVTSAVEHNAVWRCLKMLEKNKGVCINVVPADKNGQTSPESVERALTFKTKLIVFNHASNVLGTVQPIQAIGEMANLRHIPLMVDTAQTAGHFPIDMQDSHIDILAFTGHKGLMGPMGIGGLVLSPNLDIEPLISGGTGGDSAYPYQPDYYPNHLEAGTLNVPGIIGLSSGIDFINETGLEGIHSKIKMLYNYAVHQLDTIPGIELYGPLDAQKTVGVIPFNLKGCPPEEIAFYLDQQHHVMIRAGLHCAPSAHQLMGTLERGTCRIGLSYYNSKLDVDQLVIGLRGYLRNKGAVLCI